MDTYVKIAACSVVCAILCAVLKPHEGAISLAVSILCAAGAAIAALGLLSPVLEFFEKLLSYTGLSSAVFSPLLKTVAIAILGQVAGAFCQDAGQGALGNPMLRRHPPGILERSFGTSYRARSPGQVSRSGPRWFQPERCSRRRCCARLHPGRRRRTQ